jgi:hypothetical protein
MNAELHSLIRETGYLSGSPLLTDQNRYDFLTSDFWRQAKALGYNTVELKRLLWKMSGRPQEALIAALPEAPIQTAVIKAQAKEKDPRKRIKETALAIALLYRRAEKAIQSEISQNLENPDVLRAHTTRIRRELLIQAASWLGASVPGLYLAGSRIGSLHGPHEKAAQALILQEMNRFREIDAQLGRHIEEVIAEATKRKVQADLSSRKPDYTGLRERPVAHKTIDGKELGLADYAMMVATTAARDFFNMGAQNGILSRGDDLALISREVRANSCGPCRNWAGKIVSLSGRSKEYPALQTAIDAGLHHPHCIHVLLPIDYGGST